MEVKKEEKKPKQYSVCGWISEACDKFLPQEILEILKVKDEDMKEFNDDIGFVNPTYENIHPSCMGTIVDTCCRVILEEGNTRECLRIIEYGFDRLEDFVEGRAKREGKTIWEDKNWHTSCGVRFQRDEYRNWLSQDRKKLRQLSNEITKEEGKLTKEIVRLITILIRYNNFFRGGFWAYKYPIVPNDESIKNIITMAERAANFLKTFKDVKCGLYFSSRVFLQPKYIKFGDGDFWNYETFFDMKVSKNKCIYEDDLKQQIIYYMLSRFDPRYDFKKCIIFNPRWGVYYEFKTADIPEGLIKEIESKW